MNKQELLTQYEQDARTKEIISLSLEPKTKLFLSGLVASAGAFIISVVS